MPRSEEYKRRNDPYAPDKVPDSVYPKIEKTKVEKVQEDQEDEAEEEAEEPEPEPEEEEAEETEAEEEPEEEAEEEAEPEGEEEEPDVEIDVDVTLEGEEVDLPIDDVSEFLRDELDEIAEQLDLPYSTYSTKADVAAAINEEVL